MSSARSERNRKVGVFLKVLYSDSPGQSLNRFDQHSIDPQHQALVELVHGEVLDVPVDDDRRPGVVDAVSSVFSS